LSVLRGNTNTTNQLNPFSVWPQYVNVTHRQTYDPPKKENRYHVTKMCPLKGFALLRDITSSM